MTTAANAERALSTRLRQQRSRWNLKRTWSLYAMLLIPFILLCVFLYVPMYGILMAFQNFAPHRGVLGSPWVGMYWFEYLLSLPDFRSIVANTVIIAVLKMIFAQLIPVTFALLLNEVTHQPFKKAIQTMVYLPHFLSWVIVAGIFIDLLSTNGMVNRLLGVVGIQPIFFLGSNTWFRPTLVFTDVWKEFGWGAIVYLAALTGVDPSLYEAADVDGAGRFRRMWHVTLPGIRAVIVLLATLSLGNILNAGFEQVLVLYNPAVYPTADIIDTYVYRSGLLGAQYSLATAIGLFKSVIGFVLIVVTYRLAYRLSDYRIF